MVTGPVIYTVTITDSVGNKVTININAQSCETTRHAPKLIHKVEPKYPSAAKKAYIEGTVVLQVTIDKDGTVGNLHVISGPMELIPSAMKAVEQWRYQPYLINNEPVEVETQVQVIFQLNH